MSAGKIFRSAKAAFGAAGTGALAGGVLALAVNRKPTAAANARTIRIAARPQILLTFVVSLTPSFRKGLEGPMRVIRTLLRVSRLRSPRPACERKPLKGFSLAGRPANPFLKEGVNETGSCSLSVAVAKIEYRRCFIRYLASVFATTFGSPAEAIRFFGGTMRKTL